MFRHMRVNQNAIQGEVLSKKVNKSVRNWKILLYDVTERLAALDLEPLKLRRLMSDRILYYKCLHDLVLAASIL